MAVLPIVVYPDPLLFERSEPVEQLDESTRQLISDMIETMYANDGGGLAAIQVGVKKRIFVVDPTIAGGGKEDEALVFINPEIIASSGENTREEGCLSFPGVWVPRKRPQVTTIRARNRDWEEFELTGEGIMSRAFHHENDHLNGATLIDLLSPMRKKMALRRLRTE